MAKPIKSSPKSEDVMREIYFRTAEACTKNYLRHPNVICIGVGLKETSGRVVDDKPSFVFYVRQKLEQKSLKKSLPRFIYARTSDGKIDYKVKLRTDVIVMKEIEFAQRSGTRVGTLTRSGAITIVFKNKVPGQSEYYLITCAHVAGKIQSSSQTSSEDGVLTEEEGQLEATTVVISPGHKTPNGMEVDYDIALAKFDPKHSPKHELQVAGSSEILGDFLPSSKIQENLELSCAFPVSNSDTATVHDVLITPILVNLPGYRYFVKNLVHTVHNQKPLKGDSGGLFYKGDKAVGILVAVSGKNGYFHPLDKGFAYLQDLLEKKDPPRKIKCF
jgi:hypothetical protein